MPVEPGQARAGEPAPGNEARTRPPVAAAAPVVPAPPAPPVVPAAPAPPAAPRPPHDGHELPDGRYLLAYRSAPDA
jgi:hypothetical protein